MRASKSLVTQIKRTHYTKISAPFTRTSKLERIHKKTDTHSKCALSPQDSPNRTFPKQVMRSVSALHRRGHTAGYTAEMQSTGHTKRMKAMKTSTPPMHARSEELCAYTHVYTYTSCLRTSVYSTCRYTHSSECRRERAMKQDQSRRWRTESRQISEGPAALPGATTTSPALRRFRSMGAMPHV